MTRTATKNRKRKIERFQIYLGPFNPHHPPHGGYATREELAGFLTRWADHGFHDDCAEILTVLAAPKAARRKGGAA